MATTPRPPASPAEIPRGALMAAGALVLVTLLGTAAVRLSGVDVREPQAPVVAERHLRVVDEPGGDVGIVDARDGSSVATLQGENGFVRATLRGFARERKRAGFGPEQPFVLAAHADGRITLTDPATGRLAELAAFGPDNVAAFARLLPQRGAAPTQETPR